MVLKGPVYDAGLTVTALEIERATIKSEVHLRFEGERHKV
jgi:hypothetical protein